MVLAALGLFLWAASLPGAAPASNEHSNVLVLHSYHQGYPFTDRQTAGIDAVLNPESQWLEQHVVYMDAKRANTPAYREQFRQMLFTRYRQVPLAGVLATDNDALLFVVSNRQALCPGVPVVFSGINGFRNDMLAGQTNITGVVEENDYEETLKVAMKLQPGLRRLAVITDGTTTGLEHERAMLRLQTMFLGQLTVEILSLRDLSMEELRARLRRMAPNQAVLLLNHYLDRHGQSYSHEESLSLIVQASAAPIYVVNDIRLQPGVVGGKLVSGVDQGTAAARMMLAILKGDSAAKYPIQPSPNRWIFDYAGLQRWGIGEAQLPPGSEVVNRPVTFWRRYQGLVVAGAVLALGLLGIIVGLSINLTRRRGLEAELKETNQRLATLFQNAGDAILVADPQTGRIEDANLQAEKLLGRSRQELLSLPHSAVHPPDKEAECRQMFAEARQRGESVHVTEVITADQRRVPVEISASTITLSDGRVVIQGIFRDVTARNQMADQMRQGMKMEAVGHLAGGVAHDFNNLLTIVMGHLDLLMRHPLPPASAASLNEIKQATDRAADLTRQLLAYSRQQILRLAPVEINQLLKAQAVTFQHTAGERILVQTKLTGEELWVDADPVMIRQVIRNLALNACDAMPEGGTLTFAASPAIVDGAHARLNRDAMPGNYILMTIVDTGVGMDETTRARLFEPFFTTKDVGKGMGLSLAAVHGIVHQHQGWLEVQSAPKKGTTVSIYWPASKGKAVAKAEPAAVASKPVPVILLAEDETAVRTMLADIIEAQGYRVLQAPDGEAALDMFHKNRRNIDLLLTDMVMPGMNGRDLAGQCLLLRPDLPVIIVSGYSRETVEQGTPLSAGIHFLAKPFKPADLLDKIRESLAVKA